MKSSHGRERTDMAKEDKRVRQHGSFIGYALPEITTELDVPSRQVGYKFKLFSN